MLLSNTRNGNQDEFLPIDNLYHVKFHNNEIIRQKKIDNRCSIGDRKIGIIKIPVTKLIQYFYVKQAGNNLWHNQMGIYRITQKPVFYQEM